MSDSWIEMVLLGMGLFFIVGTALPLLSNDHWTVRVFDFPRMQITVGATATLAALAAAGPSSAAEYAVMGVLGACLVYQVDRILPYTPLAPPQVRRAEPRADRRQLSLLVANVGIHNRRVEPLLDLIDDLQPDLVLTIETDAWWIEQLRPLDDRFPHAVKHPQEGAYGMALYARRPLIDPEIRFMVEEDVPSIHTQIELAPDQRVFVHCMHPRPPHPTHEPDTTERDAELLRLAREIRDRNAPTIVGGDLNDVSWSYTTRLFQKISGLLDPRIGRGTYNTFHAHYPFLRYPLDHIFHSEHFKLVQLDVLPYVGSDHFPVFVELQYEPDAADNHVSLRAEEWEEAQAQYELEKLEQKRKAERARRRS